MTSEMFAIDCVHGCPGPTHESLCAEGSLTPIPMPLKALKHRLASVLGKPSWVKYLPQSLQAGAQRTASLTGSEPEEAAWSGHVWQRSRDSEGCRQIQEVLGSTTTSEEERLQIASALRGHVCEAMRCKHANFVLQKLIETLPAKHLGFCFDELLNRQKNVVPQFACHKYGCRILKMLLEHGPREQVQVLAQRLLEDITSICAHEFGNYVTQQVIVSSTGEQLAFLVEHLCENAARLVQDPFAPAVVRKAMATVPEQAQAQIAEAFLQEAGLVLQMTQTRQGFLAAKEMMNALRGSQREEVRKQLYRDSQGKEPDFCKSKTWSPGAQPPAASEGSSQDRSKWKSSTWHGQGARTPVASEASSHDRSKWKSSTWHGQGARTPVASEASSHDRSKWKSSTWHGQAK
eukprot:TRINITY_DN2743_c0_g1_i4.p1 TRINITY_DN2743_c0_g1~~TRINITY_DN2743_c0_g1_i4.p1  ORF type:complete len:404 (+),score=85.96 TRINITY_DN2743_c0_g1_i4:54-1265(+)